MNVKIWIYIIISSSVFLLLTMFVIIAKRKKIKDFIYRKFNASQYIYALIIEENTDISWYPCLITQFKTIKIGKQTYNVNMKCLHRHKGRPCMIWKRGVADPLNFSEVEKRGSVFVDASSFNDIMDNKIIRDLVMEKNMLMLILFCVIGCLILILLCNLHEWEFIKWSAQSIMKSSGKGG